MTGYINKEKAAQEVRKLKAINSGFFANLIENLDCNDFWKDAKSDVPEEFGEYIVTAYNKSENRWYSTWTFYTPQFNEWAVEDEDDYEVFFWANFPMPKVPENWEG